MFASRDWMQRALVENIDETDPALAMIVNHVTDLSIKCWNHVSRVIAWRGIANHVTEYWQHVTV